MLESFPVPVPDEKPVAFKKLEVHTPVPNTKAAIIIRLNSATVEISEGTRSLIRSFCSAEDIVIV